MFDSKPSPYMASFLYKFFHNETNDRTEKGLISIPKDKNTWPEEWRKIDYKRYSLHRPIPLPKTDTYFFQEMLLKRRSSEGYILGNKLTLSILANILHCGYGLQEGEGTRARKEFRTVPSAGQRYPLEVYVVLFRDIDGCQSGIYHYSVKEHALELIAPKTFSKEDVLSFTAVDWLAESNGMICISSIFSRTINKYGSRGYRYVLLEAGHVGQNMILAGTVDGLNIIPVGGVNEETIEKALGFGSPDERVVYVLFL